MIDAPDILTQTSENDAPAGDAADRSRPLADRQLALLERLAEAGLQIALAAERESKAAEPGGGTDHNALARAYARVARAVRLTVMLQSRLVKAVQEAAGMVEAQARAAAAQEDEALQAQEDDAKVRVSNIIRRVIEAEHDDADSIERLDAEAMDRVEDDDVYGDVLTRPISEMVADICKDLGLHPDWAKLAVECWAREEINSGNVGEPFEGFAAPSPLPLDGGEVGSGGDGPAAMRPTGQPPPFDGSS